MRSFSWVFVLLVLSWSCQSNDDEITPNDPDNSLGDYYFPPVGGQEWETANIGDLGWNESNLTDLLSFLEANNTNSFIVLHKGRIAIEAYFNGASASSDNLWYSAGKTLVALSMGIAQEEGHLNLEDPSHLYLGSQWTSMTPQQENAVRVRDHISMTTGLDYTNIFTQFCTLPACLLYLNEPGAFWYYHNAPYTLSQDIISGATGQFFVNYFNAKIKDKIGMNGFWISDNFNVIYASTARSMARFGLLVLNRGKWNTSVVLNDEQYFDEMLNSSQSMNSAYGYLWWLNGKSSFRLPGTTELFNGKLIPNAPDDLVAGLGFADQKLYVVPSQDLVIIRMGDEADTAELGPSAFDNLLWEKLNSIMN